MDLGAARIARIGVNALHGAMHPVYGLAWTDGQSVFIVPINTDHGDIDIASSVKLGSFKLVRGVSWCRNHLSPKSNCLLCIVLDSDVTIWTGKGLFPDSLQFEQTYAVQLSAVARGFIWNPLVDILCLLSTVDCRFYVHRLRDTFEPFTLKLPDKRTVSCGCWSENGSILVICAGTNIMVYKWVDICTSLDEFTVRNCNLLPRLTGDLRCIEFMSEQQFVCTTELPLDRLCIQHNSDMFHLPDVTLQSDDDNLTSGLDDVGDDGGDGLVQHKLSTRPSLLDQLFSLPRVNKDSSVDSASLYLMHLDPHSLEVKKLSNVFVSGLLSPDILHFCHDSASVFVGSNTSNTVSRFNVVDNCLTQDGKMNLLANERLKGICSFPSLKQSNPKGSLVMMTGQISAGDSLFPSTSDLAQYHLRLFIIFDFMQLFKTLDVTEKNPLARDSMSISNQEFPGYSVKETSHSNMNRRKIISSANQKSPQIVKEIKAEEQSKGQKTEINVDLFGLDGFCLPNADFGYKKAPVVEIIQDLKEKTSEQNLCEDEVLETEFQDFETTVPRFNNTSHSFRAFSDNLVMRKISDQLTMENSPLVSSLKTHNVHASQENSLSSDVSKHRTSNVGSKCDCANKQMTDILSQLKELNLKFKIQEQTLIKLLSTVESMQFKNSTVSHQPSSNPQMIRIVFQDPSNMQKKLSKNFILDNLHLRLNSVLEAFNLASVELIFDGEPCVVSADAEGFIPLIFNPNETIFITGRRKESKNEKYP